MSAFDKVPPQPIQPVRIPKKNGRLILTVLALLLALAAAVLMLVGFVDAGSVSPEETEGPAPPIVQPGTLPE